MNEVDTISTDRDAAFQMIIGMYADEPCRICGSLITREDISHGAVFVGYSNKFPGRSAHRPCWVRFLDMARQHRGELDRVLSEVDE